MSKELHGAVLAIQSEIGTLQKNAINPHFKSRYLSLDALVEHVQPLLTRHGLVWITQPSHDSEGRPYLRYRLIHAESGESTEDRMPLLLEKNNAQGLGSAITYARRYALCAVLNIVADVDDDGEKATRAKKAAETAPPPPVGFASLVRATGMKGNEIRAWLQTDGGFSLEDLGPAGELKDFLDNKLSEDKQTQLLAWANGA